LNRKYIVVQTPKFERAFRKLDSELQRRISTQLLDLEDRPETGKRLHGRLKGLFSLRTGHYRIVYEIRKEKVILLIVEHRRTVYEL
jgi:mRNA-degrading endonuclease RelE of RelBE toxin-antitoxin system